MAKKNKGQRSPTPIKSDVADTDPAPSLTPEQQAQAQRLRRDHAVLKVKFADVSVALDVATQECDQMFAQLQQAQQIIQNLSQELKAAKEGPAAKDTKPEAKAETPSEE